MEDEVVSALMELIRHGKREKLREVADEYFKQLDSEIEERISKKRVIETLLTAGTPETPKRRGRRRKEDAV